MKNRWLYLFGGTLWLTLLLQCFNNVLAQPRTGYYTAATLDGKNGRTLELALRDIIYPHTYISYNQLWESYKTTDSGPADSIPSSYTGGKTDLVYDMYAWMKQFPKFYSDGDHTQTGGFNREHCVPNSWWGKEKGNAWAYTDLHHLVPADGSANSAAKSDNPLGDYADGMSLGWPLADKVNSKGVVYVTKANPCSRRWDLSEALKANYGGATSVFEPTDEYKGDFARMYLYVVCAYEGHIHWFTNYMFTSDKDSITTILPWAKALLLQWHRQDPVSTKELNRNNAVEGLQGNRNPFIDYPELVEYIWGNKCEGTTTFSLAAAKSAYDGTGKQVSYITIADMNLNLHAQNVSIVANCIPNYANLSYRILEGEEYVSLSDGKLTAQAAGTAKIEATFEGDARYEASTQTFYVNVLNTYLKETFDTNDGTGGNDDQWSGSIASNNAYMDNAGWTLTSGHGADRCLRMGTNSTAGVAQTPAINFTGDAVISFKAGAWSGDAQTLNLSATSGTLSVASLTLTNAAWKEYVVKITGVEGSTRITFAAAEDKNNRFFLDEVKVSAVSYYRNVIEGNFGTICLPNAVAASDYMGARFYSVIGKTMQGEKPTSVILKQEEGGLTAGRPYIFQASSSLLATGYSGVAKEAGTYNGLIGTLENNTPVAQGYYMLSSNKICKVAVDGCYVNANRAYIDMNQVPNYNEPAVKKGLIQFDLDEETAISDVDATSFREPQGKLSSATDAIYNLAGQRISRLQKGINIINRQKVMVQ